MRRHHPKRVIPVIAQGAAPAGGGSGTVTSVGLATDGPFVISGSPVTISGTLTFNRVTEPANTVWAGPTTGAAALPTFRALVTADLPAGAGSGTVTSISAGSGITLTPNPITTTGTVAVTVQPFLNTTLFSDVVAASPVLGDLIVANGTPAWTKLAGNTVATRKFLRQTGTGAVSALPVWDTLITGDLPAGTGTVTSISAGSGITLTPNPITATGTVAVTVQAFLNTTLFSDVVAAGPTRGDLIVGNLTPKWARLPLGSVNQVLGVSGSDAAWITLAKANLPLPLDHHADLANFTANDDHTQYVLLAGRSPGQNLTLDSGSGGGTITGAAGGSGTLTIAANGAATGTMALVATTFLFESGGGVSPVIQLLDGAFANRFGLTTPANITATYTVTVPPAQGAGALTNDGTGILSWNKGTVSRAFDFMVMGA